MWKNTFVGFVLLLSLSALYNVEAADTAADADISTLTYDFIVVGGGAGGAVMAGRLSKGGLYSVLLLDAGDYSQASVGGTDYVASSYYFNTNGEAVLRRPLTRYDVPAFATSTQSGSTPFSPTPSFPIDSPQGVILEHSRILGGNSVHNNMQWNRQSIYSIESWNVTGWSYNDLLPYFKRTEDVTATHLAGDPIHGQSGPMKISEAQALDKSGPAYIQGCINAGYNYTNDFSGAQPIGCGPPLFNIDKRGIRSSALHTYVAPALQRPKFKLIVKAWVAKVTFDESCNPPKATGVKYVIQNEDGSWPPLSQARTARANKEVIVSAGAVNSPKLLLLSGVGPAAHLQSKGIHVVADVPIGKRQGTHPIVLTGFKYMSTINNPNAISYPSIEYAINGTGLFASVGFPAQAQLKSKPSLPDFDIFLVASVAGPTPAVFSIFTLLVSPKQRDGQTLLQTNDFRDNPYFNFTFLKEDDDVTALARSIQINRNIVSNPPADNLFGPEVLPGTQYATLPQLKNYIRNGGGIFSTTHLFGGCQIGNKNDPLAPLDNRGRVKKVQGVRVCDLSVAPGLFNGSPQTNIAAWCEKISDYIFEDHENDA